MDPDTAIVLHWITPDGAFVQQGEAICVMQISTGTVDIKADVTGTLHHCVRAGDELRGQFTLYTVRPASKPQGE